jgi:MFS family permease
MADSGSQGEPASSAVAAPLPAKAPPAGADLESLLWRNNALQILSNGAWYVAVPFIPLYLASQGASIGVIGTIIGVSGVAPLLISLHAGALVDERGPAAVAKVSVLLFALAGVILTALPAVWATGVAYALMGVANIGFAVAPQAVVAAASTPATRVRNFGYYALWNSAGAAAGPVIAGIIAGRFGYRTTFALVWLLMIPSFAFAGSLGRSPAARRRIVALATVHKLIGTILHQRGIAAIMFISFVVACGQTLQQSFYPLYLHKVGLSPALIGIAVAMISLSSMLVRSLLTRGVEQFGYSWLLLGALALAAVSFGITPLLRRFGPLVLASGLMGASTGFTQPVAMSLLAESVAAEFWGVAFGIRQGMQRLSAILSPIAFGLITTASGVESAFFVGGAALLGAVLILANPSAHLGPPPA